MPFELGADLGLRLKGPPLQRRRKTLILDAVAHRYDRTLSDISGMDPEVHGDDPVQIIQRIRDWLNVHRDGGRPLPGGQALHADYIHYQKIAPDICDDLRLDPHAELKHPDYLFVVRRALPQIAAASGAPEAAGEEGRAQPPARRRRPS